VSAAREWQVYVANEVRDWIDSLDDATHTRVQAIDALADVSRGLGRPLADTIHGSSIANLQELRADTVRILFALDPWRDSIPLVGGDKASRWTLWYREAIPLAEALGHRLAEVRRARSLTQQQIADRMGVTKGRSPRSNAARSPDTTSSPATPSPSAAESTKRSTSTTETSPASHDHGSPCRAE
jgi:hypothetical protein